MAERLKKKKSHWWGKKSHTYERKCNLRSGRWTEKSSDLREGRHISNFHNSSKPEYHTTNVTSLYNPGTLGIDKASSVKARILLNYSCLLLYSRLHEEQENISLQPLHSYQARTKTYRFYTGIKKITDNKDSAFYACLHTLLIDVTLKL